MGHFLFIYEVSKTNFTISIVVIKFFFSELGSLSLDIL